jgi:large subunit ribosomal protein L6
MKKEIFEEIEIPDGVEVQIDKGLVKIKGPEGENERKFKIKKIKMEVKDKKIVIGCKEATKKEKKNIFTIVAHIKNMIKGVTEKFEYTLKIVFSHFPITVEVQENEATIKNFLGEKIPRKSHIPNGVEVAVNKDIITVKSHNKELAGQAAANLEKATKVGKRDPRIFQDGIYITNKAGREI